MKKLFGIITVFVLAISLSIAQAPLSFKYQAVARDVEGNVIADKQISLRISLVKESKTGSPVYSETHNLKTGHFGLIMLEIGKGENKTGDISTINWAVSKYFVNVAIDINGGSDYTSMGVSQLLSVPYALYAERSGNGSKSATSWTDLGSVTYLTNPNDVGIGTDIPGARLHVIGTQVNAIYERSLDNIGAATNRFYKSRGTTASKSPVATDDYLGSFQWWGYTSDGTFHYGAILGSRAENVTTDNVAGNFVFMTTNNSYAYAERMRLTADGQLGIGTTTPDASAALEVNSTTRGFLQARMSTTEMNAIINPATGLSVYNTDVNAMCYYNGNEWDCLDAQSMQDKTFICGNLFNDFRDNNIYRTVKISSQCWMAENLAYLPSVSPSSTGSDITPYYYVYDYQGTDVSVAKTSTNYQTYGVLYNWPAVMNGESSSTSVPSGVQGICPSGWHLPSDGEWTVLTNYLGGLSVAGGKMKEAGTTTGLHQIPEQQTPADLLLFQAVPLLQR